MVRFALFGTELGTAALAWTDAVVVGVQLPSRDAARTQAQLLRYHPDAEESAPTPAIGHVISRIQALLAGGHDDLRDVEVDLSGLAPFQRRVYEFVRTIPPGQAMTYGQVAEAVGAPGGAQAVGQAMGHNPVPIVVPCHRVVAAQGRLGGFSAPGGATTKRRMLTIEGADLPDTQPALFDWAGNE
jgi:methylated-DNA-[protein]-cysteine S-methyltransferase